MCGASRPPQRCRHRVRRRSDARGAATASSRALRRRCDEATSSARARPRGGCVDGDERRSSVPPWSGACVHVSATTPATSRRRRCPVLVVGRQCAAVGRRLPAPRCRRSTASSGPQRAHRRRRRHARRAHRAAEVTLHRGRRARPVELDVPPRPTSTGSPAGCRPPPRLFDTVPAGRPADGLLRFLDPATVVVVGAGRPRAAASAARARAPSAVPGARRAGRLQLP